LEAARQIGPDARPGLRAAREWVVGRDDDIRGRLERLHELRRTVRRLPGPLVLCHTDLHGGNVLVDDEGHLCLLDWDDAKMAPPEHDLWSGLGAPGEDRPGADFGGFLDAYRRAGGAAPLHLEHFAFYLLRRHVEDMAVGLRRLLDWDADEREEAAELRLMETSRVQWSRLDDTLAIVADALQQDRQRI
jgi:aminoglycoside phosphotransferase (APT) family kinase protein